MLTIEKRPVFLIGFMGTGKSTVGRLLAARLERPFLDLDERLVEEAHATIPEIFANEGERGFRTREAELVRRVCEEGGARVIAAGGGAPCHAVNLTRMLTAGVVVCLTAGADQILERVGDARGRPILARVTDPRREVERLLAERAPFYGRAHVTVDTTARAPSQVVAQICAELGC